MSENLYVSGFNSIAEDWAEVGSTPWLNDSDANYVYTKTDGAVHSEFTFADHAGSETITALLLYVEIQGNSGRNDTITIELWDGTQWVLIEVLDPDNDTYQFYYWDVLSILDTWAKINGAKLRITYDRSGSPSTQEIYVRRAYLHVEYSTAPVNKNFSDVGGGSDAFGIPFKAMQFSDVGEGIESFATPFKAMGFADSGQGVDSFGVLLFKYFVETAGGTDVFGKEVIGFIAKEFSDVGSGIDAFATLYREMGFADTGHGEDVFAVPLVEVKFSDAGYGVDVFTMPYREMKFIDSGHGVDSFYLFLEKQFGDVAYAVDVFSVEVPIKPSVDDRPPPPPSPSISVSVSA